MTDNPRLKHNIIVAFNKLGPYERQNLWWFLRFGTGLADYEYAYIGLYLLSKLHIVRLVHEGSSAKLATRARVRASTYVWIRDNKRYVLAWMALQGLNVAEIGDQDDVCPAT